MQNAGTLQPWLEAIVFTDMVDYGKLAPPNDAVSFASLTVLTGFAS
jgi:hypothetical protein